MADSIPYSKFACVGTGFSGIGLGATLQRWYKETDIVFFERRKKLGGTWYINKYPGECSQGTCSLTKDDIDWV